MIRHIDELGRLVIPSEIRYELDIGIFDGLDVRTENNQIIITKSNYYKCPSCHTTINKDDYYCRNCGKQLEKNEEE